MQKGSPGPRQDWGLSFAVKRAGGFDTLQKAVPAGKLGQNVDTCINEENAMPALPAQPPAAVIYTRVSTGEQADHGTSLDSQRAACRAKAAGSSLRAALL